MTHDNGHAWADPLATGIATTDRTLHLRWLNPALAECWQAGLRSATGQPLARWMTDAGALASAARVVREQCPVMLRGATVVASDGHEVRVDVAMQPFDDGLLLELHPLGEASPADSPLSATLRGFAHEVKNPLAGLRGAAQLLQRRVGDDDLRGLAGLIIDEADRLAVLADRLLRHDGAARLARVNIHQVLDRLEELVRAEPDPPSLHHDYDPSVPDLTGDPDRLLQVLLNLATNARQAGARTLTLRTRVEHGLRLGERMLRTALRVDLADDGPGVPIELRDTLFHPLVSGRADGNGLGLALSREIAHEHGGELRHARRPGETVFSLYLPLERSHD